MGCPAAACDRNPPHSTPQTPTKSYGKRCLHREDLGTVPILQESTQVNSTAPQTGPLYTHKIWHHLALLKPDFLLLRESEKIRRQCERQV